MRRRRRPQFVPPRRWESDYIPARRGLTGPPEDAGPPRWMARTLIVAALALVLLATAGVYLRFRPLPFDPQRWQTGSGFQRGRMLASLLAQTDFVGFSRAEVETYLGGPDFDERQFWYDLGPDTSGASPDPRAAIGEAGRLYAVFAYDLSGSITNVLYNYRRPLLGSQAFDSAGWFGHNRAVRRTMFIRTLGRLRAVGLDRPTVQRFLGPPDGARVRAQYDVGTGGAFIGSTKALILTYDADDVVIRSTVAR